MNYYYAYHGPTNENNFDFTLGYGLSLKSKRDSVAIGEYVFIIQNIKSSNGYELCGLFRVVNHYDDPSSKYPHRFSLEDISKLPKFISLNEEVIGLELPVKKWWKYWLV